MSTAEVQHNGQRSANQSASRDRVVSTIRESVSDSYVAVGGPSSDVLGAIKQVVAETPTSRIPEGVKVRVELTSNGGRYFIYRYTDRATKKRKAIYGGKSSTLSAERIAQYEKRRKK